MAGCEEHSKPAKRSPDADWIHANRAKLWTAKEEAAALDATEYGKLMVFGGTGNKALATEIGECGGCGKFRYSPIHPAMRRSHLDEQRLELCRGQPLQRWRN